MKLYLAHRHLRLQTQLVQNGQQSQGRAWIEQVGDVVQQIAEDLVLAGGRGNAARVPIVRTKCKIGNLAKRGKKRLFGRIIHALTWKRISHS